MIKFKQIGGPYGDSTSWYEVQTDAKTVGEFIDEASKIERYGQFCIRRNPLENICVAAFSENTVIRKAEKYDTYAAAVIEKVDANGGWGMMGYDIKVKNEQYLPDQPWEEFQAVYWGHRF